MNLPDLLKRRDRALGRVCEHIEPCAHRAGGVQMLGLRLPHGAELELTELMTFDEMRVLPRDLGWAAALDGASRASGRLRIAAVVDGAEHPVAAQDLSAKTDREWHPLRFEWPTELLDADATGLILRAETKGDGVVYLGVTEVFDLRRPLLAMADGVGIEVGPGANPQVLPRRGTDVRYLERSPIEEWSELYRKTQARELPSRVRKLWDRYVVGDAQQLDIVEPASIDFVFSSHVFEHFVNPLGTLAAWRRRLRAGGRVLGVVPDAHNCFDLRQPLSRERDWQREWHDEIWEPEDHHYEKWCAYTEPRVTPANLRERGYSIHAHYYTPETFAQLLDLAVQELGYARCQVRTLRNNKDFAWLLTAP
ncbi:MAG: class I SAM-dependent methyltransferase [Planctomycetota bacterium]